ncbi:MAG: flippase-like domain-containing protein [Clostridium sp.]|nr:flippase-like domain-containing protein [Clostridium sp.]MCM1444144.1 flippase-like domain-containing protein [Candidatus Amulumruptor caecigallinarius]
MSKKSKKWINFLLLFIVVGIVLYFSLKDNFFLIINELKHIDYFFLIIALIIVIFYYILRSFSLYEFIKTANKDIKFISVVRLILMMTFFDGVTPFASGSQPFQIYYLKKKGVTIADATNITIQNFIVYQLALVLFGVFAIISNYMFNIFTVNSLLKNLVLLGFITNLLVTIGLFMLAFLKRFNKFVVKIIITLLYKLKIVKNKEEKIKEFEEQLIEFNLGAKELLKNKNLFLKGIFFNILSLSFLYSVPLFILFSLNDFTSINLFNSIVTTSYVMLIGSFVPIPGGTGGLEYGFIAFFSNFLIGEKLTAAMLVWRVATYYFGILIGALALIKRRKKKI